MGMVAPTCNPRTEGGRQLSLLRQTQFQTSNKRGMVLEEGLRSVCLLASKHTCMRLTGTHIYTHARYRSTYSTFLIGKDVGQAL